jgi:tol-pal system protein YbgF
MLLLGALSLAGCSSLTPTNDPVYLRITDMEARLIRIERVLENESLISLAQDIASLRTEVQTLLGDTETLRYELDNQSDRQRDLYVDLDQRLSAIEAAQSRQASMPSGPAVGGDATLTDAQAYDAAFARIQQQDWVGAQAAFEGFLVAYPVSQRRSNAQYWLGETLYAQLDFRAALAEFQKVLDQYPQSSKMPDALLKIGFSNYELGNSDRAREALLRVVREYPDTSAAGEAEKRLQRIADETR